MGGREIPVFVVGLNPTALGLVRSLALHCESIVALESDEAELGMRTRLARVHRVDDLSDHAALGEELRALAHGLPERPVLFLSTDEHVLWAVQERGMLERHFRVILPERTVCETLMYKDRFLARAQREGEPVPPWAFLPLDDLPGGIERAGLRYPLILKPTHKTSARERAHIDKAFIVRGPLEAADVTRRVRALVPALLAQEYLEGGDDQLFFCLYFGAAALPQPLTFCGRKLLQWPPLRGSTAACAPAPAPDLEDFTRSYFGRLGVEGFASLEAKYLPDGRFMLIEPTIGRVDLQSYVATLNGMNMPMVAYLVATGRADEAAAFARALRTDVAWIYEASLWSLLRAHALEGRAVMDLARRSRGYALGSWSDPRVLGAFAGARLQGAARRALAFVSF